MITWTELAERCERATGPDRELDCDIVLAIGFTRQNRMAEWPEMEPDWNYTDPVRRRIGSEEVMVRKFTASLDAITALIAERLPGWGYDLVHPAGNAPGNPRGGVFCSDNGRWANAATSALALCAAFCRAMAVREDGR